MNYRQIWQQANGPIPVDEQGRSYEIHHVDGNRKNNDLSNLVCITIEEHLRIHEKQGDEAACHAIRVRMHNEAQKGWKHSLKSREKMSIAKKGAVRMPHTEGKVTWTKGRKASLETKLKMSKIRKGVSKGPQVRVECPHCGAVGGNAMKRWHFNNCKTLFGESN